MSSSIWSRKLDLLYVVYFCIHLPIMFIIDLTSIYPASWVPSISTELIKYSIANFQDQFFVSPPPFFIFFTWMEAVFHIPVCLWSIPALLRNDARTPLVLLIYGMQTLVTTAVCIWDYCHWTTVSTEVKWGLTNLYGPYIALSFLMVVDASKRIANSLTNTAAVSSEKKRN